MVMVDSGVFVSAPGKIILFGEHAVVYGRTAVAGSIDLRTYVSLYTSQDGRIYLSLPDLQVEKTWLLKDLARAAEKLGDISPDDNGPPPLEIVVPMIRKLSGACEEQCGVQHLAVLAFWYLLLGVAQRKRDMLAVKVTVRFKLPSCVGLGSSGAYCVCTAAALLMAADLIPKPTKKVGSDDTFAWEEPHLDMIRRWAAQAESLIHGRASGLDAAICTYGRLSGQYQDFDLDAHVCSHGGVASFKPGTKIQHIKNLPDLKVILVNSKIERNTSRMVATVKDRLKKYPEVIEGIFNAVDAISREAIKILNQEDPPSSSRNGGNSSDDKGSGSSRSRQSSCSEEDHVSLQESTAFTRLNDLCRMNNQLLITLGVGHPKIDGVCTTLSRYGIHPKMTGAGGGGSVFAFMKPDTSQTVMEMISQEISKLGFELYQPMLGSSGVCFHGKKPEILATPNPPKSS